MLCSFKVLKFSTVKNIKYTMSLIYYFYTYIYIYIPIIFLKNFYCSQHYTRNTHRRRRDILRGTILLPLTFIFKIKKTIVLNSHKNVNILSNFIDFVIVFHCLHFIVIPLHNNTNVWLFVIILYSIFLYTFD